MAKNKKPRKKYVPKTFMVGGKLPTPAKVLSDWEIRAWNAVAAIRQGRYDRDVGLDLILVLTMIRDIVPNEDVEVLQMLHAAFKAINAIKDRFDRTGRWGASGDDLRVFEETIPPLLGLLPQMNRGEFYQAMLRAQARLEVAVLKNNVEQHLTNDTNTVE